MEKIENAETLESLKAENKELKQQLAKYNNDSGAYECFHCGSRSVVWCNDFSFEDYCLEGEGIVHSCICANCGANIDYYVPLGEADDKSEE